MADINFKELDQILATETRDGFNKFFMSILSWVPEGYPDDVLYAFYMQGHVDCLKIVKQHGKTN